MYLCAYSVLAEVLPTFLAPIRIIALLEPIKDLIADS